MSAQVLDGRKIAAEYKSKLHEKLSSLVAQGKRVPGLAVILLGDDPASKIYVNNKRKTCQEIGLRSFDFDLPIHTSEQTLLELIKKLNEDEQVDGILVQLPLPSHIQSERILEAISPTKDVDGFHPWNLGRLAQRNPLFRPCTPLGIMHLLQAYNISLKSKNTLVIGASNIVGRPLALEFLNAGATVSIAHRLTTNLEPHVRLADIIVVATGVLDIIDLNWLNETQVLIDVGIHRLSEKEIRGDIDYHQARHHVAWITPVPGGVGPMTIMALVENTFLAYELNQS